MAHDAGHGQCETVINWGEGFVLFTGILFESCKSDDWMGEVGTVVDNACVESGNHGARTPRNGRHDTLYKCDVHLSSCINSSPPTPAGDLTSPPSLHAGIQHGSFLFCSHVRPTRRRFYMHHADCPFEP